MNQMHGKGKIFREIDFITTNMTTVQNFSNFPATLILREIDISHFENPKIDILIL